MKRVDDLPPFPSLSLSFSLTRRQPSLLYPLFLSALSPFRLVSHPISGPHPRGFSPLQPDSSISRGSKSCRFYEPPRRAYIYIHRACARGRVHTETRERKYVESAISVTRLTALYPDGKFPFRTKKPRRSRAARLPTSCRTCT